MSVLLSLPVGGGYWRKSASGDGECPDCTGQGRGAGLCPAGELQQWGSLHREPATALQRKSHLCNKANFLHMFQNISLGVVRHVWMCISVLVIFWLRRTLAPCWYQWTLTKSWRFTPSSRWSATEESASTKYRLTCESLHCPQTFFIKLLCCQPPW